MDIIEAYARQREHEQESRKAQLKDEVICLYNQALQISNMIASSMDSKVIVRKLSEYYPEMFKEDEDTDFTNDNENKLSLEMQIYKANMDDFIFRHNLAMRQKREQKGENNGRNDTGKAEGHNRGLNEAVPAGNEAGPESDQADSQGGGSSDQ